MKTCVDCIPCFARQAVEALGRLGVEESLTHRALRRMLHAMADFDMNQSPPEMARVVHAIIREEIGNPDPYREIKDRSTERALSVLDATRSKVLDALDPFEAAARFAIAGNVMDYALLSTWSEKRFEVCLDTALHREIDAEAMRGLKEAVAAAETVLVLGDNAGETVFDRLWLEQMPDKKLKYAVKGHPIINDATRLDAEAAGIGEFADIISNGSDAPGTVLEWCSAAFLEVYEAADVVLAKGQANFETLSEAKREVFFLTQLKCPVIAEDAGGAVGDWVVASNYDMTGRREEVEEAR